MFPSSTKCQNPENCVHGLQCYCQGSRCRHFHSPGATAHAHWAQWLSTCAWCGVFLYAKPLQAPQCCTHTTVIFIFLESDLGDLWVKKEAPRQILQTLVFSWSRLHRRKTRLYTTLQDSALVWAGSVRDVIQNLIRGTANPAYPSHNLPAPYLKH